MISSNEPVEPEAYKPVEVPLNIIEQMIKAGSWEDSMYQEEVEYNLENGLYKEPYASMLKKVLTKEPAPEEVSLEFRIFAENFTRKIYKPGLQEPLTQLDYPLQAQYRQATKDWWNKVADFERAHPGLNPLEYTEFVGQKPNRISMAIAFIDRFITQLNGTEHKGVLTHLYVSPEFGAVLKLSPNLRIANPLDSSTNMYFLKKIGSICNIEITSVFNMSGMRKGNNQRVIAGYEGVDEETQEPYDVVKGFELILDFDMEHGFLEEIIGNGHN